MTLADVLHALSAALSLVSLTVALAGAYSRTKEGEQQQ